MRIIVISSVRPEPTSGGQIVLHRHLVNQPGIEWKYLDVQPDPWTTSGITCRIVERLAKTRLHFFANDLSAWRDGRWRDGLLPKPVLDDIPTAVLTVAQGEACGTARRFAQKHNLPLVTFFHDWWPDMVSVHSPFHQLLGKYFCELYQQSTLALCVSEAMRAMLGPHPNAQVLYPIPAKVDKPSPSPIEQNQFRVLYFGNLYDYGPMLADALNVLKTHAHVRLEVRGGNPQWPQAFRQEMQRQRLWYDHASGVELEDWLVSANAFLVPMVFEPAMRRRMETSFPSKMLEMSQFFKPLVIWGPEYCSAVQWARTGNRALCVTDPNPTALRQALEQLATNPGEQERLAAAAREAAQTDFNPDKIQAQFMQALRSVVKNAN